MGIFGPAGGFRAKKKALAFTSAQIERQFRSETQEIPSPFPKMEKSGGAVAAKS